MGTTRLVGVLVFAATAWLACGSDYSDESHAGERFNSCYPNGTCNTGLTCVDSLCVIPESSPNDGGAVDSEAGPQNEAGMEATGDGLIAYAKARCTRDKACFPRYYATRYVDDADCEAVMSVVPDYPGIATANDDARACAVKIETNTRCALNLAILDACLGQGTLADGAPCDFSRQCANGFCANITAGCGTCATAKRLDEPCDVVKGDCAAGLYCALGKCDAFVPEGNGCNSDHRCALGTACKESKCTSVGVIGDSCTAATAGDDCYAGLTCESSKCAEQSYGKAGDACGSTSNVVCVNGSCINDTCTAYLATGASCGSADVSTAVCDSAKDICSSAGTCAPKTVCK